jgi:hypothetical protein
MKILLGNGSNQYVSKGSKGIGQTESLSTDLHAHMVMHEPTHIIPITNYHPVTGQAHVSEVHVWRTPEHTAIEVKHHGATISQYAVKGYVSRDQLKARYQS